METRIEPYSEQQHRDAVVDLSLRAWAPVFVSLEQVFEPALYQEWYPEGWRKAQAAAVEETCRSSEMATWVATADGQPVGFVAVKTHSPTFAEIYMIAVDPEYQRRGISQQLTAHALDWMKSKGVSIAMVETGGDPGHGPARRAYEKAGFGLYSVARYFKKL